MSILKFLDQLALIPAAYFQENSDHPGKLVDFYYDSYESFSYQQHSQKLRKHAVVYLPYNYSPKQQHNVFYLMHGGWSNEETYLGSPANPQPFKNVLDNAIATGKVTPMIVICPTYNNLSPQDSSDYGLALRLTDNYHHELINDLLPAVEGRYSTFARDTSLAGLKASRDHRAFCGFSMGSVTTWRTFQYCLAYFRYFFPSSGAITSDGRPLAQYVKRQGYTSRDFFIFAASGTADFAYSGITSQVRAMAANSMFKYANNEKDGNLFYLVSPGGTHGPANALEDFYNALTRLWKEGE